jgi:hypothetical protein
MSFVQAAADLLAAAGFDVTRADTPVTERQSQLGVRLPAAVAEWYALPAAHRLIATNSCDELVPLSALGDPIPFWPDPTGRRFLDRDFLQEGLLFLGSENQGVVLWAVPLDEGPDPRVMVDTSPPDGAWVTFAESFSDYAEALVWDLLMFGRLDQEDRDDERHGVTAQDMPLSDADLAALTTTFAGRPSTYGWPMATSYRFERPGHRILLWAGADGTDWWIYADTPGQLDELIGDLWRLGTLADSLYGITDVGEAIVRERRDRETGAR